MEEGVSGFMADCVGYLGEGAGGVASVCACDCEYLVEGLGGAAFHRSIATLQVVRNERAPFPNRDITAPHLDHVIM